MSLAEAIESTSLATRQLASRQLKWFRRDPRVCWIDVALDEDGAWAAGERERVVEQALALLREHGDRL